MIEQALCIIAFILAAAFCIWIAYLFVYAVVMYVWSVIVDFAKEIKRIYL